MNDSSETRLDEPRLRACVESLIHHRGIIESLTPVFASASKGNPKKVSPNLLPGNLATATIAFKIRGEASPRIIAPIFIAASYQATSVAIKNLSPGEETPYFACSLFGRGDIWINSPVDGYKNTGLPYRCHFRPLAMKKSAAVLFQDSEFLLANAIDIYLRKLTSVTSARKSRCGSGVIYMATERLPCELCSEVMRAFLSRYRHFRLVIAYTHDHGERDALQLQKELGPRMTIYRHAYEIEEVYNPPIGNWKPRGACQR